MSLISRFFRKSVTPIGELGTEANPVRCDNVSGEQHYLRRLRDQRGKSLAFSRVGSMGVGPYGNIVDLYVVESDTVPQREIYMDMYHRGHVETKAVPGLFIFNLAEMSVDPPPKNPSPEQLRAFAVQLQKASRPDAETLRELLGNTHTVEQCSQILVFTVSLIMFSYGRDRDKVIDGLLRNSALNLTRDAANMTYDFITGE